MKASKDLPKAIESKPGSKPNAKPEAKDDLKSLPMAEVERKLGSSPDGLSQAVQEKLLADIDAQLLRLESEETDGFES